ncbi:replication protein C, IncQ-type [Caballeronia sp. Lep1P3]|uniref:replication protein C, IncQ-type n=1 Tax=Burkholderiaceae TaxID=119060 RepID=UPI001FD08E81|nr:replication protein C, IncQ-type [Caballeronia sp. Lep1P3]
MTGPGTFVEVRLVRYDTALATAGVFCSLPNGPRPKLDVTYEFAGLTWRWRGPDRLGIPEQTLLLVLLELAQEQIGAEGQDACIAAMEDMLYANEEARRPPVVSLHVSFAELCRKLGRGASGGSASRQIRRELERLCEVTVWMSAEKDRQISSRLLAWRRSDNAGVDVVLNWRLAEVLFGGQFSPVSLGQRLSLTTDCARALHCSLSVRMRPGGTMQFKLDTLAAYVWSGDAVADATVRRRRQEIRDALQQLGGVKGWTIKPVCAVPGTVRIVRWSTDWQPTKRVKRAKAASDKGRKAAVRLESSGDHSPNIGVDISALCV